MTAIDFVKVQGLGNDFILVDARGDETELAVWQARAQVWCDRHFGVGADGLLVALPAAGHATVRMEIINPDGSIPEMCGNGIRCFASWLAPPGSAARGKSVTIETAAGDLTVSLLGGSVGGATSVRVDMGAPRFTADQIPVAPEAAAPGVGPLLFTSIDVDGVVVRFALVSTGNPHAIAFVEEPVAAIDLGRLGPVIERDPRFPRRTNVHIVNRIGTDHLVMRSWERGAGLTLACGTGACAVAVADILERSGSPRRAVDLPGGRLEIEWGGEGPVFMTGPASEVFRGTLIV